MGPLRSTRLLATHPGIRQARINSPGGAAWAGAYLGRLFGWAGLEAVVSKGAVAETAPSSASRMSAADDGGAQDHCGVGAAVVVE